MSGRQYVVDTNSDGTPLHASDYDKQYESETAKALEEAWKCELHPMGRLCPIDYYALKHGRMVGVIEIKRRYHKSDTYPTVFLGFRKWIALMMAQLSFARGIYVVTFDDGIFYIPVDDVDPSKITIGGEKKIIKSHTDIGPMIHVPLEQFKKIASVSTREEPA